MEERGCASALRRMRRRSCDLQSNPGENEDLLETLLRFRPEEDL